MFTLVMEFFYPKEQLHSYFYHKGKVKKGANNVCYLILKILHEFRMLREVGCSKELNTSSGNSSGQQEQHCFEVGFKFGRDGLFQESQFLDCW